MLLLGWSEGEEGGSWGVLHPVGGAHQIFTLPQLRRRTVEVYHLDHDRIFQDFLGGGCGGGRAGGCGGR